MSSSDVVRSFRSRLASEEAVTARANWRKRVMGAGIAISAVALGSIIVQAQDSSGVYEIAKQYNPVRSAARAVQVPSIFRPAPVRTVPTSLSYAPVFQQLMPVAATGKRDLDRMRNDQLQGALPGSPRKIKVTPQPARGESRADFEESYVTSRTSYCVRTCDGFFFPVGTPDSGDVSAHEAACQRACPNAETAVYVAAAGSNGIEDAVTRKGQRYDALRTAFNYRTQFDNACTCNSSPRNYSVMTDFTLRKGDLVMGTEGMRVFQGGERWPYRQGDFARVDAAKLSPNERVALQKLEASSLRNAAAGKLSPSLKARIEAQVATTRVQTGPGANRLATQVARRIQVQDGRQMRYVGPDMDFDRAR